MKNCIWIIMIAVGVAALVATIIRKLFGVENAGAIGGGVGGAVGGAIAGV